MQTKDELRQEIEALKNELKEKSKDLRDTIDSKNREIENLIKQRDLALKENEGFRNSMDDILINFSNLLKNTQLKEALTDIVGDIIQEHLTIDNSSFSQMYGSYGESINLYWDNDKISSADITMGNYGDD